MHGRKKNGLVNEHDQIIAWKVRYSISIWFYEFLAWVKHSPLNCTSSLQWIRQKIALYAEVMNKKSRNKITAFFIFYCFKFPNIEFKCAVKDIVVLTIISQLLTLVVVFKDRHSHGTLREYQIKQRLVSAGPYVFSFSWLYKCLIYLPIAY